jgi:hypothetical protein
MNGDKPDDKSGRGCGHGDLVPTDVAKPEIIAA